MKKLLVTTAATALLIENASAHYQKTEISCNDWNSREFFESATATDVKRCLAAGADIESRDKWKATPLHNAARWGSVGTVRALIDAGADVNAEDTWENTPVNSAESSHNLGIVNTLIKAGAKPARWRVRSREDSFMDGVYFDASYQTDRIFGDKGISLYCVPYHKASTRPIEHAYLLTIYFANSNDVTIRNYGKNAIILL
ncbi:MAG: ankyrin repeat domain-containing protein [Hyphomonadaceae bacterium]|nr:ankyrin repeat domain-containing protein [Hyphomonadaceae bacterium]MBC6412012.1 ankyrin repeat domain-containing protein [Hyphomonadaceae bacterium]